MVRSGTGSSRGFIQPVRLEVVQHRAEGLDEVVPPGGGFEGLWRVPEELLERPEGFVKRPVDHDAVLGSVRRALLPRLLRRIRVEVPRVQLHGVPHVVVPTEVQRRSLGQGIQRGE